MHSKTFKNVFFFKKRLRPSDVDVRLLAYTHQLLQNLEEETGVSPGYNVNGGLFIASSKVGPTCIFKWNSMYNKLIKF